MAAANSTAPVVTDPNNSTDGYDPFYYQPFAPVPYWHQDLELSFICIFNALTLILIIARVVIRRKRLGRFRKDDIWIMAAGILLIFPYWTCQIGTNRYGSGLHEWNAPPSWMQPELEFSWGQAGYYIIASLIKVSVLFGMLEILPSAFFKMRLFCYILAAIIFSLGIALTCVWEFQCLPFMSNWDWSIVPTSCIDVDATRFSWIGISVVLDICIVAVPFAIIRQIRLERHERIVLLAVFGANLLGTIACAFGLYGVYSNIEPIAIIDDNYTRSTLIMTNCVEIFLYALGASATIPSRYLISRAKNFSQNSASRGSDWRQNISWPTSNETYYAQSPTLTEPQRKTSKFGSFGLKRGFKGSDVKILEGFDLVESPHTASTPSARSAHGLLGHDRKDGSFGSATLMGRDSPAAANTSSRLADVGGLISPTTRHDSWTPVSPFPQYGHGIPQAQPQRVQVDTPSSLRNAMTFSEVTWQQPQQQRRMDLQDRQTRGTPVDAIQPIPWEEQGPIYGWNTRR